MNNLYLSVIIPMFNEEKRIDATLRYILAYLSKQNYNYEIIAVNDGSTDTTADKVHAFKPNVTLLEYAKNRGKGYAVNYGLARAKGEYILICDADNATPFEQIERLLASIAKCDIAIGSRYVHGSRIVLKQPWQRIIGSRVGNLLIQLLILPGLRDTQCGFKLFTQTAVKKIIPYQTIWRWGFDMELLVIAREKKLITREVPVDWYDRTGSKVHSSRVFTSTLKELFRVWINRINGLYSRPS